MNTKLITRVVILGVLAIIGILSLQAFWIYQSWTQESKEFNERVTIALREVAEKISKYNNGTLPSQDIIIRESANYYLVNIDDVIDANVLEHYLYSTFSKHAILIDFEYAVFDCHTKEMVYGNYCNVITDEGIAVEETTSDLPRYDEFIYYFGVRFPTIQNYLFKELGRVWIVSGILLLTLLFFSYAIYVILIQKRWAELQKDFISNMTHEFKTPISSIKISSDVMSKSPEIQNSKKLNTYLSIIKSQNQRLNRQVEQVLSLSKLENDKFELQVEKIQVQKVFEEIEEAHRLQIESLNGKFILQAPQEGVFIRADRSHFFNVLNNLVDNAVKYSDDAPIIHLVLDRVNDKLIKIEVRDQGKGIPPEYIDKITDKFFRVPKGNVHDVKGFGLGLYYVNNICKGHKWTLKVESKVGNGTICRIFINTN